VRLNLAEGTHWYGLTRMCLKYRPQHPPVIGEKCETVYVVEQLRW
jgi:hypothetical protein